MRHLVLSQCTRVTDGQTDRLTDEQNYDSQDRRSICSRGKNLLLPEICVEDIVILIGRDIHCSRPGVASALSSSTLRGESVD